MCVPGGRVVCTLEGGYDPHGLAVNIDAFLQVLSRFDPVADVAQAFPLQAHKVGQHTQAVVQAVKEVFREHHCNWWGEGEEGVEDEC